MTRGQFITWIWLIIGIAGMTIFLAPVAWAGYLDIISVIALLVVSVIYSRNYKA